MAMRYCKDCKLYECCLRTPLGGCQEFDNVVTNPTKPTTLEEARQLLKMELDWDWEKFRREAAKDILAGLAASGLGVNLDLDPAFAVKLADELIAKLKEK